jgi:hypothetical protein
MMKPKVLVGVQLKLEKVVDLTNPHGVRAQPWLPLNELLAEDWRKVNDAGHESQSQAFGRAAHDAGAEALLAPSARVRGGANLVYFPESAASPNVNQNPGRGRIVTLAQKEIVQKCMNLCLQFADGGLRS